MDLPERVQACFLLNVTNMTEDIKKLARTTTGKLSYSDMKGTIMRIFGVSGAVGDDTKYQLLKKTYFMLLIEQEIEEEVVEKIVVEERIIIWIA